MNTYVISVEGKAKSIPLQRKLYLSNATTDNLKLVPFVLRATVFESVSYAKEYYDKHKKDIMKIILEEFGECISIDIEELLYCVRDILNLE